MMSLMKWYLRNILTNIRLIYGCFAHCSELGTYLLYSPRKVKSHVKLTYWFASASLYHHLRFPVYSGEVCLYLHLQNTRWPIDQDNITRPTPAEMRSSACGAASRLFQLSKTQSASTLRRVVECSRSALRSPRTYSFWYRRHSPLMCSRWD